MQLTPDGQEMGKSVTKPTGEAVLAATTGSATVNWFCPACLQWFQTLQMPTESRIQSKVRIREDHIRNGCAAYSPNSPDKPQ